MIPIILTVSFSRKGAGKKWAKTALVMAALILFTGMIAAAQEAIPDETIVYRTKNGTKYHRENCSSLKKSKIRITLGQAISAGLKPCAVCKPPELKTGLREPTIAQTIYRVSLAKVPNYAAVDLSKMLAATVIRHVDGDTVRVRFDTPPPGLNVEEVIRMIGVDTPETVHPNKAAEYFGKEASDWTKNALLGKPVHIALDWDTRDRYGRLLAYIYTAAGTCHNAELIIQGYAHAYTRFPFQFLEEFRALEQTARAAKRGLWASQ